MPCPLILPKYRDELIAIYRQVGDRPFTYPEVRHLVSRPHLNGMVINAQVVHPERRNPDEQRVGPKVWKISSRTLKGIRREVEGGDRAKAGHLHLPAGASPRASRRVRVQN